MENAAPNCSTMDGKDARLKHETRPSVDSIISSQLKLDPCVIAYCVRCFLTSCRVDLWMRRSLYMHQLILADRSARYAPTSRSFIRGAPAARAAAARGSKRVQSRPGSKCQRSGKWILCMASLEAGDLGLGDGMLPLEQSDDEVRGEIAGLLALAMQIYRRVALTPWEFMGIYERACSLFSSHVYYVSCINRPDAWRVTAVTGRSKSTSASSFRAKGRHSRGQEESLGPPVCPQGCVNPTISPVL